MGMYKNLSFAALLDDRNTPIPLGGVGEISDERAARIMAHRPDASLQRVDCAPDCEKPECAEPPPPRKKQANPQPKAEAKTEAKAVGAPGSKQDPRAQALELDPKHLKELGRALGLRGRFSGVKAKIEAWPDDKLSELADALSKLAE